MAPVAKLSAGAASATGPRDSNEDSVLVSLDDGHFVVADGTGGRAGGKTAATLACEAFGQVARTHAAPSPEGVLTAGFEAAHRTIREQQRKNAAVANMCTTLVAAVVRRDVLTLGHLGDSRAYRLRGGRLELLTRDHSYGNYLADNPDAARVPGRPLTALMGAVGMKDERPQPSVRSEPLMPGDRILLCSDGITSVVPDWLLTSLLEGVGPLSPDQAAGAVVSVAHTLGSTDNASAVVLHAEADREEADVMGWLACVEGEHQGLVVRLGPRTVIGGEERGVDVPLRDAFVSGKHAEIVYASGGFQLRDLDSKNGTFLNESTQRVRTETLVDGDRVRFGSATLVFRAKRLSF